MAKRERRKLGNVYEEKMTEQIVLRLTPAQYQFLEARADYTGGTILAYLRNIIDGVMAEAGSNAGAAIKTDEKP